MQKRVQCILIGLVLLSLLVFALVHLNQHKAPRVMRNVQLKLNQIASPSADVNCNELETRIAELSRSFNQRLEDHAIFVCSLTAELTSKSGAYCASALKKFHKTDMALMDFLCKFFKDSTVGSFGDGLGIYKRNLLERNCVTTYEAYDGTPNVKNISEGRVQFLDLSMPQYGLPKYDIVMSLEVGEHIPAQFEDIFLDNLVRHAKNKIILSWAVPGQKGLKHINNRDPTHVIAQMKKRGFSENEAISKQIRDAASFAYLKKNYSILRAKSSLKDDLCS